MKKSLLVWLLAMTMAVTMLAGCAKKDKQSDGASQEEITDFGSGEIKIWVAENVTDFTKEKAEQFIQDHSEYSGYTIKVEAVGEGDAASNMITDVEAGADIYGFAQDQPTMSLLSKQRPLAVCCMPIRRLPITATSCTTIRVL